MPLLLKDGHYTTLKRKTGQLDWPAEWADPPTERRPGAQLRGGAGDGALSGWIREESSDDGGVEVQQQYCDDDGGGCDDSGVQVRRRDDEGVQCDDGDGFGVEVQQHDDEGMRCDGRDGLGTDGREDGGREGGRRRGAPSLRSWVAETATSFASGGTRKRLRAKTPVSKAAAAPSVAPSRPVSRRRSQKGPASTATTRAAVLDDASVAFDAAQAHPDPPPPEPVQGLPRNRAHDKWRRKQGLYHTSAAEYHARGKQRRWVCPILIPDPDGGPAPVQCGYVADSKTNLQQTVVAKRRKHLARAHPGVPQEQFHFRKRTAIFQPRSEEEIRESLGPEWPADVPIPEHFMAWQCPECQKWLPRTTEIEWHSSRRQHFEKEHGRTYKKHDSTEYGRRWTEKQRRLRAEGHPDARAR